MSGWPRSTAHLPDGVLAELGTFRTRTYPLPIEAAVIGGPDAPVWGWASLLTGVLPLMEQFGIATGAEVGPATLASRLLAETVAADGVVISPPMIAAAARTDPR
jgi:hypothetical protein